MKISKIIALIFALLLLSPSKAQEDLFLLYGGDKNDFGVSLVEKDGAVGYLILGSTRSYGSGSSDYYLISVNSDLQSLNETSIGGNHHDLPKRIYPYGNNNYVIIGSVFDFKSGLLNYALTYVDGLGNFINRDVLWRAKNDIAGNLIQENGNNIIVGMSSDVDSRGQTKLLKIDSEGNVLVETDFGEELESDYGFDIISNELGYILLSTNYCEYTDAATFISYTLPSEVSVLQVDEFGEALWEYRYVGDDFDYAYSMVENSGFIYVAMNTRSGDAQSFDCKILKLNTEGELVDSYLFGGEGFEYAYRIIVDSNKDLVVCGVSSSDVERPSFYAFKMDQYGDLIWERKLSTEASIYAYDVIESSNGSFLFTGKYAYSKEDAQVFLVELDKDGVPISQSNAIVKSEIKMYPNPTGGKLIVNTGDIAIKQINIYSIGGEIIYSVENSSVNAFITIDLAIYSSGMYILDLVDVENIHYKEKISLY